MTTLQQEIDVLNIKMAEVKKANTVENDFPTLNRSYTYKKSTVIKANDLNL